MQLILEPQHRLHPVAAAHAGRRRRQRVARREDERGEVAPLRRAAGKVRRPEGLQLRLGEPAEGGGVAARARKVERVERDLQPQIGGD